MQNNNVSIIDGTTFVQVGSDFYPKNSLSVNTRGDKVLAVFTLQGYQITNWLSFNQYKDSTNAPYTSFANALTAMQTIFFK